MVRMNFFLSTLRASDRVMNRAFACWESVRQNGLFLATSRGVRDSLPASLTSSEPVLEVRRDVMPRRLGVCWDRQVAWCASRVAVLARNDTQTGWHAS